MPDTTTEAPLVLGNLGPKIEPIDTSQLHGANWAFVGGYLIRLIEEKGQATRADAEKAIAQAIERRPR